MRLRPGQVLADRYQIIEMIGQGGEGNVYKAYDHGTGRPVAIKVPRGGLGSSAKWFRWEQAATSAVRHPNVVRVLDKNVAGQAGPPYLVTELIDGGTLAHDINFTGSKPAGEAAAVAAQIADGLAAVHQVGLVHRDVKPSNVMVRSDGVVKVIDLGSSVIANERNEAIGTRGYWSPEMARTARYGGVRALLAPLRGTPQADLYSLGLLIHEMVTGRQVFGPDSTLKDQANARVPRLSDVAQGVPPELDRLVADLTRKDPRDRPSSAAAVSQALTGIAARSGTGPRNASASTVPIPVRDVTRPIRVDTAETSPIRATTAAPRSSPSMAPETPTVPLTGLGRMSALPSTMAATPRSNLPAADPQAEITAPRARRPDARQPGRLPSNEQHRE